jgi:hypothetical protein
VRMVPLRPCVFSVITFESVDEFDETSCEYNAFRGHVILNL